MAQFLLKLATGVVVFGLVILMLPVWTLPAPIADSIKLFGSSLSYFDFMLPMSTLFTILTLIVSIESAFMTLKIWFMIKSWFIPE